MNKILKASLGFYLLLIPPRPVFGQSVAVPNGKAIPEIIVYLHDYVQVPQETLVRAEEVTSGILRKAGVGVVWVNCNYVIPAVERGFKCAHQHSSMDLIMNLVDRIQPLSPNLREVAMGLAVVPLNGREGDLAYLSMHQAASVALESSVPLETILGLGAAHELGHLLLGENTHTSSGLMKRRWGPSELEFGSQGGLLFTSKQSDRIRTNLLLRQKENFGFCSSDTD